MNTQEVKTHLRDVMRGSTTSIADHLREVHGITEIPKTKQAQHKLHGEQDHGDKPQDARSAADASVLAGITRKDTAPAANAPKPRPSTRKKTENVPLPGDSKPAQRTTRKPAAASKETDPKPATRSRKQPKPCPHTNARGLVCIGILNHDGKHIMRKPQPETQPATNGTSPREHNQELARDVVTTLAAHFKDAPADDWQKVANWLHALPTGGEGAGWLRWWPENTARPTSAGWRKPE